MGEQRVEVGRAGSVRREPAARRSATTTNADDDDEPRDRHRPAQEPLAQQAPPARARVDRSAVLGDDAHVTRIRGLRSE